MHKGEVPFSEKIHLLAKRYFYINLYAVEYRLFADK